MSNRWGIPSDIEEFVLKRDKKCVYCAKPFTQKRAEKQSWEHIINDINITTADNIALCCVGCNASKGNKILEDWVYSDHAKRRGVGNATLSEVVKKALRK